MPHAIRKPGRGDMRTACRKTATVKGLTCHPAQAFRHPDDRRQTGIQISMSPAPVTLPKDDADHPFPTSSGRIPQTLSHPMPAVISRRPDQRRPRRPAFRAIRTRVIDTCHERRSTSSSPAEILSAAPKSQHGETQQQRRRSDSASWRTIAPIISVDYPLQQGLQRARQFFGEHILKMRDVVDDKDDRETTARARR